MQRYIEERVLEEANYVLKTLETVRKTAEVYGISKSTVHKDLQERLVEINPVLHKMIIKIFNDHNKVRHLKGGAATKAKYSMV